MGGKIEEERLLKCPGRGLCKACTSGPDDCAALCTMLRTDDATAVTHLLRFFAFPGHLDELPCNAFVWCAAEGGCWEPDIHKHSFGDCWLKFTEGPAAPEVNMRGELSQRQRSQHPDAPTEVQWHAGAVLPRGVELRNGSWSPRYEW